MVNTMASWSTTYRDCQRTRPDYASHGNSRHNPSQSKNFVDIRDSTPESQKKPLFDISQDLPRVVPVFDCDNLNAWFQRPGTLAVSALFHSVLTPVTTELRGGSDLIISCDFSTIRPLPIAKAGWKRPGGTTEKFGQDEYRICDNRIYECFYSFGHRGSRDRSV